MKNSQLIERLTEIIRDYKTPDGNEPDYKIPVELKYNDVIWLRDALLLIEQIKKLPQ